MDAKDLKSSKQARQRASDLLIGVLNPHLHDSVASRLTALSDEGWEQVVDLAREKGVSQRLHVCIRDANFDVPEGIRRTLREDYRRNALRNLHLLGQLHTLVSDFREAGIPVLALKGMHLVAEVYRDPTTRFVGDIDVLVRVEDLETASQRMLTLGYQTDEPLTPQERMAFDHQLAIFIHPAGAPVEIHWNLTRREVCASMDPDPFWIRSRKVRKESVELGVLSLEDLLLHLCIHTAYHHQFDIGLRPSFDIAELLWSHGETLDWELFVRRVNEQNCRRGTFLALLLAQSIAGAEPPTAVFKSLRPADFDESLAEAARRLVLSDQADLSAVPRILTEALSQDPNRTRIGRLWERIFLPRLQMARVYGLAPDSPWVRAYYVLRVFDLLRRWGGSGLRLIQAGSTASEVSSNRARLSRWFAGETSN